MTIESFFIGTRRSDKRYGPQSKDMQVSEFISLISPKNAPHKVVLPDFTGLASRLDAQIRNQFHQLKEDEHFLRYRQLSERWYQAGSISDRNNRSKRFEKIMDDSLDFCFTAKTSCLTSIQMISNGMITKRLAVRVKCTV